MHRRVSVLKRYGDRKREDEMPVTVKLTLVIRAFFCYIINCVFGRGLFIDPITVPIPTRGTHDLQLQ